MINYKLIITAGFLILAVLLAIEAYQIYTSVPEVREAITLATTKKPETFTELYFENHLSLPSKVEIDRPYTFAFTIHNLENKDMNYPYEVYLNVKGEKLFIQKKSVFVKKNEYKTINEEFTLALLNVRVNILVNLINKNQSIDFWIEGSK